VVVHHRLVAGVLGALAVLAVPGLAAADDDGDRYGQCKYVCADKLIICVQPGSCDFGDPPKKESSLVPPTPEKLVEGVTAIIQASADFAITIFKLAI
jgi:hypothetical protein